MNLSIKIVANASKMAKEKRGRLFQNVSVEFALFNYALPTQPKSSILAFTASLIAFFLMFLVSK